MSLVGYQASKESNWDHTAAYLYQKGDYEGANAFLTAMASFAGFKLERKPYVFGHVARMEMERRYFLKMLPMVAEMYCKKVEDIRYSMKGPALMIKRRPKGGSATAPGTKTEGGTTIA